MNAIAYAATLIIGSVLAYFFVNPLSFLVYFLVWLDIVVIARIPAAESLGFEVLTLAAIIGGVALGAVAGFLFALVGIPLLATLLNAAVFRTFSPRIPSFDFVAVGIAAMLAGFLVGPLSFIAGVFLAVFFKHVIMNATRIAMGGGISYGPSFFNIVFTWLVLIALKDIGLLAIAGA